MPYELYSTLGLNREASLADIKRAYKKLALTNHPDKGGDEKKFQEISNAYNILSDPNKKRDYDRNGSFQNGGGNRGAHMNPHDIFNHFFGNRQPQAFRNNQPPKPKQHRCNDITHELAINLEDVAKGVIKTFKIKNKVYKEDCYVDCHKCYGSGQVQNVKRMGNVTHMTTIKCDVCIGEGIIIKGNLKESEIKQEKELNVKLDIPKGISNNHRITLKGNGEQPKHHRHIAGDLIFIIKVRDHNTFARENNNLVYRNRVSFIDAVCGKTLDIDILGIDSIQIDTGNVFGIIKPNFRYPFQKKGLPIEGTDGRGDLFIMFDIDYPTLNEHKRISLREEMENII